MLVSILFIILISALIAQNVSCYLMYLSRAKPIYSLKAGGMISVPTDQAQPLFADRRDLLPYTLYLLNDKVSKSPINEIGTLYLDSTTQCGDYIELQGAEYVVRRVTFVYKYGSRGLQVVRKKIDVTAVKSPKGFQDILQ